MKKRDIGWLLAGMLLGSAGVCAWKHKGEKQSRKNVVKYLDLFRVMNQYVVIKQQHKDLAEYFEKRGYERIAVYGMSHIGQRLIDDLKGSKAQVIYGVDKRADRLTYSLPIYDPSEDLPEVDAIVVTAHDFDEIAEVLVEKLDCEILRFSDILFDV